MREARYIIGQPPLTPDLLARMASLRCIFNMESNLLPNMPYEDALARGIRGTDAESRGGRETWGGEGNASARLLTGSTIGILGMGALGQAVARVL